MNRALLFAAFGLALLSVLLFLLGQDGAHASAAGSWVCYVARDLL